mmetsp:Transcript_36347/g.79227  ORF Transcript_36347/g.79227 Transcript_36347/m.79227 type:complete len:98 (-) Transcript_36347:800-1093(-)
MTSMRQKSDGPSGTARAAEVDVWVVDVGVLVVVAVVVVAAVVVAVLVVSVLLEVVVAVLVVVFGGEGRSRIQERRSALEAPKRAQTSDCSTQPVPGR